MRIGSDGVREVAAGRQVVEVAGVDLDLFAVDPERAGRPERQDRLSVEGVVGVPVGPRVAVQIGLEGNDREPDTEELFELVEQLVTPLRERRRPGLLTFDVEVAGRPALPFGVGEDPAQRVVDADCSVAAQPAYSSQPMPVMKPAEAGAVGNFSPRIRLTVMFRSSGTGR